MKLSIVISASKTKFKSLTLRENLKDNFKRLSSIGYDGIELAIRDPKLIDANKIKNLSNEFHLPIIAVGTGQAYIDEGLSLTHADTKIREAAILRLKEHIAFASKFNAQVIIGLIRGKGSNFAEEYEILLENLHKLSTLAQEENVILAIEPINRYETNLINTIDQALDIITKISSSNLKILADTFHMNIEEPSIPESIKKLKGTLSHLHVADSNRWLPGYGHIDFKEIIQTLKQIKYDGYISLESLPKPVTIDIPKTNIKFFKALL